MKTKQILKMIKEYEDMSLFGSLVNFNDLPMDATLEEQGAALQQDILYIVGKAQEEQRAVEEIKELIFKLQSQGK